MLKPLADASDCQRDYINACYVDVSLLTSITLFVLILNLQLYTYVHTHHTHTLTHTHTHTYSHTLTHISHTSHTLHIQGYSVPNKFIATQGKLHILSTHSTYTHASTKPLKTETINHTMTILPVSQCTVITYFVFKWHNSLH